MNKINYNGHLISSEHPCISSKDRGYTLGHGLFETILVKKSTLPALDYHWQRLQKSASLIGIKLPFSYNELEWMIHQLIIENNLQDKIAGARVTITHGEAERGILPMTTPEPNFLISLFELVSSTAASLSALIVNTRKNEYSLSSQIKSISYLDNILARQEAKIQGYDEAILLNSRSHVADGATANIYIVQDGQIFTPPISDGALPGVIRSILIQSSAHIGLIIEKSISTTELLHAEEVFLSNALIGVKSIHKINQKEFSSINAFYKIKNYLEEHNFM